MNQIWTVSVVIILYSFVDTMNLAFMTKHVVRKSS